ncbi:MAG: hypothetical protein ISR58_04435 [Anaerolineales bacterium]|nr:hypothetical protein [Chloroflexota bacterium]MBL6980421.1 hypothetical protein [Anaerolineales bacterium]
MNSRQRFLETLHRGNPDRVPLFGEGIRSGVFKKWKQHGVRTEKDLARKFAYDRREEIYLNLDPHPSLEQWPTSVSELDNLRANLDPDDPIRMPDNWNKRVKGLRERDYPLMLRVHEGLFLTLGVMGWGRFEEVMYLLTDEPDFVIELMNLYGEFAAKLTDRILQDVMVDAVVFSEPIGGNDGSLVSPKMHEEYVLKSLRPLMEVVDKHGVESRILRTYANTRVIIPGAIDYGINCLWACEVEPTAMDYLDIRREFGNDLRLMAGIDLDNLLGDKAAIKREVERVVPPLLEQGGYIPLLDGRVREYIPFENYQYYRELLEKLV